ncbi:MAG: metalloregulator ArsR/SmtB family transcription factor [Xanthomonadales bacterium]|nr:metalloregulator ArsR/SmtB family transcription factor [Xanthomonadales bacterium]
MTKNAASVERLLKSMANTNRLLLLCELIHAESSVGALADAVGMKLPAASQQLALLRREGLVKARREGQTIYYSIARRDVQEIMRFLYRTFCENRSHEEPAS